GARVAPPASPAPKPLPPTVEQPAKAAKVEAKVDPKEAETKTAPQPIVVVEPEVAAEPVDEGLPELPGEATAIASNPTVVVQPPPAPGAVLPEMPAEQTRITTKQDPSGTPMLRAGQLQPVRRGEVVTGQMQAPTGAGLLDRLGRRGGIVVGVVIGV